MKVIELAYQVRIRIVRIEIHRVCATDIAQTRKRCESVRSDFRDLGRDVGNAHIVLRTIGSFWELERRRARSFAVHEEEELRGRARDCQAVLLGIESIRAQHIDAITSEPRMAHDKSHSKYVFKDMSHNFRSIRERLQDYTSSLSFRYTVLTRVVYLSPNP